MDKIKQKPTIGVVAISYNEEEDMPHFLQNLIAWVDEIIIVDDGSTDKTVEIIKSAGNKVKLIKRKMGPEKGFAAQRNIGLKAAESDWILHMDIDERVTPELAKEIKQAILSSRYNAFRYKRLNFFLHRLMKAGNWNDWNNPQLARKGKHHFEGKIHERCIIKDAPRSVGQLKNKMWHLNDSSYLERMEKSFKYCQEVAERIKSKGIKVKWYYLLLGPLKEFVSNFILKKGFIDGIAGLLAAIHSACATFRSYALIWDEQNKKDRANIEKELKDKWKR